eukprot:411388-Amphidinium_carterae.1
MPPAVDFATVAGSSAVPPKSLGFPTTKGLPLLSGATSNQACVPFHNNSKWWTCLWHLEPETYCSTRLVKTSGCAQAVLEEANAQPKARANQELTQSQWRLLSVSRETTKVPGNV